MTNGGAEYGAGKGAQDSVRAEHRLMKLPGKLVFFRVSWKELKNETNTVETITISRSGYDAQKEQIAELNQKVDWPMEQLCLLRKKQFGASSEQSKEQLDGQLSLLFNEAEAYAAPSGPQKATQMAAHTRKQSGSVKDVVPDNIPVEVVEHRLSEEERACPQCGEPMQEIGTEV